MYNFWLFEANLASIIPWYQAGVWFQDIWRNQNTDAQMPYRENGVETCIQLALHIHWFPTIDRKYFTIFSWLNLQTWNYGYMEGQLYIYWKKSTYKWTCQFKPMLLKGQLYFEEN